MSRVDFTLCFKINILLNELFLFEIRPLKRPEVEVGTYATIITFFFQLIDKNVV